MALQLVANVIQGLFLSQSVLLVSLDFLHKRLILVSEKVHLIVIILLYFYYKLIECLSLVFHVLDEERHVVQKEVLVLHEMALETGLPLVACDQLQNIVVVHGLPFIFSEHVLCKLRLLFVILPFLLEGQDLTVNPGEVLQELVHSHGDFVVVLEHLVLPLFKLLPDFLIISPLKDILLHLFLIIPRRKIYFRILYTDS